MPTIESNDLQSYCLDVAKRAKIASAELATANGQQKNDWLHGSARRLRAESEKIIAANSLDLQAAPKFGLTEAQVDRLKLDEERICGIAIALEEIAMLPDPIGRVIDSTVRPNGLVINKVRVPLGVVFFIYESRPNVTADAAAICTKSGNAVILRGGKEAYHSSHAIVELLNRSAHTVGLPIDAVQLVSVKDREAVGHFLNLSDYIDVAIPRGGEGLIRRVASEAKMPVIKHFAGNCHVYIDRNANPDKAVAIVVNSKCQRLGVCNAAESLVMHADVVNELLPRLAKALAENGIEMRGDERSRKCVSSIQAAEESDYGAEYLGPIISIKTVDSIGEAIAHINHYGSGHTDAIVTDNLNAANEFTARVDSSAVMVNASTRFNDGGEFGLGAEIGISTDRFHARGPCGLNELTTYKYVVHGSGQIR